MKTVQINVIYADLICFNTNECPYDVLCSNVKVMFVDRKLNFNLKKKKVRFIS